MSISFAISFVATLDNSCITPAVSYSSVNEILIFSSTVASKSGTILISSPHVSQYRCPSCIVLPHFGQIIIVSSLTNTNYASLRQLLINIAIVIGPTPPGTGVI